MQFFSVTFTGGGEDTDEKFLKVKGLIYAVDKQQAVSVARKQFGAAHKLPFSKQHYEVTNT